MASMNWSDKYKSASEVKAHFRHNEKDERMKIKNPQNFHIDKSKTHLNFSICNRSYEERCMIYDKAVAYAEQMSHTETYVIKKGKNASKTMTRTKTGMKKDTVTCLGLETAAPAGLSVSQYEKWAKRVHEIACEFFGADNVIDTDGHFDEIHLYRDPVKKEYVWSRFHIHTSILPRRADGSFCSRSIAKLCFSMIMTEHLPLGLEHAQKKLSEITVSDIVRKYKQPVVIADRIREEIVMLAPKLHDILKGK